MSIVFLKTELETLASLAKKRNVHLQQAIEESLRIAEVVGDDADLAKLRDFPSFVTPFFMACSAANAKSCASALQCLQTMAIASAIAPERLSDLLQSLLEAAQLGIGIQLKILQLLPMMLQSYAAEINGNLVVELLRVCAELQGTNKLGVVHNTAYATLQQLITTLFDRIGKLHGEEVTVDVCGSSYTVDSLVRDCVLILDDLCDVAEGGQPKFCKFGTLPLSFTLEFLELTLTNHAQVFHTYKVFSVILRQRISQLLIRLFKETPEFSITLRTVRIFYLLIRRHLKIISAEAEILISLLTNTIPADNPTWKRVLCLEVFQGVFLEISLVYQIYELYDAQQRLGLENLLQTLSSALASGQLRLNTDKNVQELSKQATMRVPCIDLLDKAEPPRVPPLYLDYLTLVCATSLADGLNRLAVRRTDEECDHEHLPGLYNTVSLPLLNSFTILLGAAMDLELYRQVVRSVQRLAHSAGILEFGSIRDDYMKLLAQFGHFSSDKSQLPRSILCIRALFNVGYALGNQLGTSWSIIVRFIEEIAAETGIEESTAARLLAVDEESEGPIEASLRRLIDQSNDFNDQAFIDFLTALSNNMEQIDLAVFHALCLANVNRLAVAGKPWDAATSKLLDLNHKQGPLRRKSAAVLDHVVLSTMKFADDPKAHRAVITAISRQANVPTDQNDADAIAVQVAAINALNQLLDQYGSKLEAGWEEVFQVISSGLRPEAGSEAVELVKGSFQSLELVCSDFLEIIPYPCVVDLTLCLDRFARQTLDLNTAFTATSRFWAVCDHLMTEPDETFPAVATVEQLLAMSREGAHKKVALWMLAQIKLGQIANEPQHQIKTGAIQIFFRLFEAHGGNLSLGAWETCQKLVFDVVMTVAADEKPTERDETLGLIVSGLGSLWTSSLEQFIKSEDFEIYWSKLMNYFNQVSAISPVIALAVYRAVSTLLESDYAKKLAPKPIWKLWVSQNTSPAAQPERVAVQSLQELVGLYTLLTSVYQLTIAEEEQAITLLANCAQYPHAGSIVSKDQLTPLQQASMDQLTKFDVSTQPLAVRLVQVMSKLSRLAYSDETTNPPLFRNLSASAQSYLLELLNSSSLFDVLDPQTALSTMQSAVMLLENASEREQAVEAFLRLVPKCVQVTPKEAYPLAVQGGKSILEGGRSSEEIKDILSAKRYISIVESIDVQDLSAPLLKCLLVNSLSYERSIYSRSYFEELVADDDPIQEQGALNGENEATELSLHGTIEPAKTHFRPEMAYFCLETLHRLANSAFSGHLGASRYHSLRARMVLSQYVGDAVLRGREPMVKVLRRELLFILHQLSDRPQHQDLLYRCISCGDPAVLEIVEQILRK